jgi:potassium efflux system protein
VTSIINAIAIPRLLRPLPQAITLCLICCIAQAGAQQSAVEPRPNPAPDLTALKKEATAVQAAIAALPDANAQKATLQERLDKILPLLPQFDATAQEIEQRQTEIRSADQIGDRLTEQIAALRDTNPEPDTEWLKKLDAVELKTRALDVEAEISNLRSRQKEFQDADGGASQQKDQLEQQRIDVEAELDELKKSIRPEPADDSIGERLLSVENATAEFQLTQQRDLIALEQRRQEFAKQFDLNEKRVELISLQIGQQQAIAKAIDERLAELRKEEAQNLAAKASKTAATMAEKFPLLAPAENVNVQLANIIGELESEAAELTEKGRRLSKRLLEVNRKYNDTKRTIEQIGRSSTIGTMLRKRKAELPTVQSRQQQADNARDRIEELQANRFQANEELAELSLDSLRIEIEEATKALSDQEWERLAEPAEQLMQRRRELLRSCDKIYDRLFEGYVEIERTNNRVSKSVQQFNEFINERILWLSSNKVLFSEWSIDKADQSLFAVENWQAIPGLGVKALKKRPLISGLAALGVLALLVLRPRLRREVDELGKAAARGSCATFWPTGRAVILTLLISVTVPLIVCGTGWVLLQSVPSGNRLFDAFAHALVCAGVFAIPFEILRRTCRPNGLAVKHFDWSDAVVAKLKAHVSWFVLPASCIVFAATLFSQLDAAHRVDLIERILFIIGMLLTASFLYRVFSPATGIFSRYLKAKENSWANQTSSVWFSAIVLTPIVLALLAFAGFYYTALNLTYCLCLTFALAVAVEWIRAIVRRFVMVRQRAAYIENAKRKRQIEYEAAKEARKQAAAERQRRIDAGEEVDDAPIVPVESLGELHVDFGDLEVQADHANQLIRLLAFTAWFFGLWLVWGEVLPAIKALDDYKLWGSQTAATQSAGANSSMAMLGVNSSSGSSESSDGSNGGGKSGGKGDKSSDANGHAEATSADSASATASSPLINLAPPQDDGVSVKDVLVFVVIVLLTFMAARNLPNAVEMLFLDSLPVDRSTSFATKALVSYVIVIIGTALALRTLSINWTSVQWLVTALTFGLAFGLQEIFANFVAGIILMFERPMRLGDMITVDNFTGVVTRIRTRATTIVSLDRKEYVIPNKDFITGRLENWTLSDSISRINFTVGVAYGSDVAKAKKIILEVIQAHPNIVSDPAPSITFQEFGNSTLNLVVRVFLDSVNNRLPVTDALHSQINIRFQEAGIEIAFPQTDLNVRTIDSEVAQLFARKEQS